MQASEKQVEKADERGSAHGPLACTRDLYNESGILVGISPFVFYTCPLLLHPFYL
jgi:hypothetical protein